jgi:diacylglycerol kinase (ATP)
MTQDNAADRRTLRDAMQDRQSALPGRGGLARIGAAAMNSMRGLREGLVTEAAIKQEIAIAVVLVPASFFVATNVWVWLALIVSLLFVLIVEFLNTAVERLCNHVTPERHDAIRVTKDLASTGVFFALCLAGLVWIVAIAERFGLFG